MTETEALVIDDSRAMRLLLGDQLRSLGYAVIEAGDGEAGLEALRKRQMPPRLVLVDWNMPVMDGLGFIQAVREDQRFHGTRLLVVTSETEVDQMMRALQAGADEYLMKPFSPEALLSKLHLLGLAAA